MSKTEIIILSLILVILIFFAGKKSNKTLCDANEILVGEMSKSPLATEVFSMDFQEGVEV